MKDLNKVMIIGNLTRDPESRFTPAGQAVASFAVATNRRWKSQDGEMKESAEFHDVVAWGKLAEIVESYLKRGRRVYIEGRLQTRSWDGQDGVKRYKTEIVASDVIILDRRESGGDNLDVNQGSSELSEDVQKTEKKDQKESKSKKEGEKSEEGEVDLDDIPF